MGEERGPLPEHTPPPPPPPPSAELNGGGEVIVGICVYLRSLQHLPEVTALLPPPPTTPSDWPHVLPQLTEAQEAGGALQQEEGIPTLSPSSPGGPGGPEGPGSP